MHTRNLLCLLPLLSLSVWASPLIEEGVLVQPEDPIARITVRVWSDLSYGRQQIGCTGVVFGEDIVLTAAHCAYKNVRVYFENRIERKSDVIKALKVIKGSPFSDFAILQLETPVPNTFEFAKIPD